jgi:predicted transcriptional regulator
MDRELTELRRAVTELGPMRPGRRLPALLRDRILAVVRARNAAGGSLRQLAENLGLSAETLSRWLAADGAEEPRKGASTRPLPVVVAAPAVTLTLVTPGGHRLEGLSVDTAAELLGRLR